MIQHHFPNLKEIFRESIVDPRRVKSTLYRLEELVLSCVYMYMMRQGSRNKMNCEGDHQKYKQNFKKLFGIKLPHMDTTNNLFEKLDEKYLEICKTKLIQKLLKNRVFHKYKINGMFVVPIDGTGMFKFENEPYDCCPSRTSKNEKKSYHQPVVEAKLVGQNGLSISLCSEFIINEDGEEKQDCEYKATLRLIQKLHQHYPKLPIYIVLDGLYAKEPIMKAIRENKWHFGVVWKDKLLVEIQTEMVKRRSINKVNKLNKTHVHNQNTRVEYEYEYVEEALIYKEINLYYVGIKEDNINLKNPEKNKTTHYKYLIDIPPNSDIVQSIVLMNRLRWKIENEGFNVQKNNGNELHHKMNRTNLTAIKNYYQCLQIATLFDQLINLCKNTHLEAYGTIIKVWEYFMSELRHISIEEIELTRLIKINLRY